MKRAMKKRLLKQDAGLGDTIARFTKWAELPQWVVRWLPHALYEKFDKDLKSKFSIEKFAHWLAVEVLKLPHCGCTNRQRRLNSICAYTPATMTIGMPHRDDIEGVWATVQVLRDEIKQSSLTKVVEILVIDQSPPAQGENKLKGYCKRITESGVICRYEVADQVKGSAAAKNAVFRFAKPPGLDDDPPGIKESRIGRHWVVCLDCHVHPERGVVRKLYDFAKKRPNNVDLHYGCLQHDENTDKVFTSFQCWRGDSDVWVAPTPHIGSDLLFGTWLSDPRGQKRNAKPFEIEACGGWFIVCRKGAWLGFHPLMKGHGGEEWYIAEAFRQRKRKVWCLPFARASHRFIRTRGAQYGPDDLTLKNCTICFKSLGYDPDRLRIALTWPIQKQRPDGTKYTQPLRDPAWVNKCVDEALAELKDYEKRVNERRAKKANPRLVDEPSLQEAANYRESQFLKHFYAETELSIHLPVLRSLAAKVQRVLEYPSKDKASSWAILSSQPQVLMRLGKKCGIAPADMERNSGGTQIATPCAGGQCSLKNGPEEGGVLFISKDAEADFWEILDEKKSSIRHFIMIHGIAGVAPEKITAWGEANPEWKAIFATDQSGGIVVLQHASSDMHWSVENVRFPPERVKPSVDAPAGDTDEGLLVVENFGP